VCEASPLVEVWLQISKTQLLEGLGLGNSLNRGRSMTAPGYANVTSSVPCHPPRPFLLQQVSGPRGSPYARGLVDRLWYGGGSGRSIEWAGRDRRTAGQFAPMSQSIVPYCAMFDGLHASASRLLQS
jgi:hypothetical protein